MTKRAKGWLVLCIAGAAIEKLLGPKQTRRTVSSPKVGIKTPPLASPSEAGLMFMPGWHGYWQVFGLAGMAARITAHLLADLPGF